MPDWLHQITTPWTTPFTLVAAVVGLAALVGVRGRRLASIAALTATGVALWAAWKSGPPSGLLDLKIYTNAARAWLDGRSIYDYHDDVFNLSATYPPIGPLAFSVFTPFTADGREVVFTAISLASIAGSAWCTAGLAGIARARRVEWALWAFAAAVVTMPVWLTLRQGQVNALLWFFVLADLEMIRRAGRWTGLGIGLATAVKLVPGLFILWLAATRRWASTIRAVAMVIGATLLGWALAPSDSRTYWTDLLWHSDRIGRVDDARNNSALGIFTRFLQPGPLRSSLWIAVVVMVLVIAFSRSVRASKSRDLLAAAAIIGCASGAVSPISWTHHLGFLVVALAAFVTAATTNRARVLCAIGFLLLVDPGGHGDEAIISTVRGLATIAAVLFIPIVPGRSDQNDVEDQAATTPSNLATNSRLPS